MNLGFGFVMSLPSLKDQGSGWTREEALMGILGFVLGTFWTEGLWGSSGVVVIKKVDLRMSIGEFGCLENDDFPRKFCVLMNFSGKAPRLRWRKCEIQTVSLLS